MNRSPPQADRLGVARLINGAGSDHVGFGESR